MGKHKSWSYKAGEKGRNRVRAYVDRKSGNILVEWYEHVPGSGKKRRTKSLGHSDKEEAKRQTDQIAAEFGKMDKRRRDGDITLRELFDIYLGEVTPEKGEQKRKHDRRAAEMFTSFLGADRKARSLNRRDWDAFIKERGAGRIGPSGKPVSNRMVSYDLRFLQAVLNWATVARDDEGNPLLQHNPLKGFPFPKGETPNRPVMTDRRYLAMLEVAEEVDPLFKLALILAHETGHRIGAIRHLRWSDVELEDGMVSWDARNDKIGMEHETPLTETAAAALRRARKNNPAIGDAWLFPSPTDDSTPCSRHLMRDWWKRCEEAAGLEHIDGMGWHSLRRKFATELKDVPLKDLCQLGGWKSSQTVLECYQRPDEKTMRKALENRRKVGQVHG